MSTTAKIVVGIIVLIPALYIGSCSVIDHQREHGFDQLKTGDSETQVIAAMGEPVARETASKRLAKYGAPECQGGAQRLWYPNKLSLAGEAWAVELDGSGRVVHTAHVTSP